MRVRETHEAAMELVAQADALRSQGHFEDHLGLLRQAFGLEQSVALHLADRYDAEPTRSAVLKSAASLALDLGEHRTAERLISIALVGDPPEALAEDLRNLLETVHFRRHLRRSGIALLEGQARIVVSGPGVGYGTAEKDEVFDRIDLVETAALNELERLSVVHGESTFNRRTSKSVVKTYLETCEAASFAVRLRLGGGQMELPEIGSRSDVFQNLSAQLRAYNNDNAEELARLIPEDVYRERLLAAAKRLLPDGQAITMVGFSVLVSGKEDDLLLTRPRPPKNRPDPSKRRKAGEPVVVTGTLLTADSKKETEVVVVYDERGKPHRVVVPDAIMSVVVPMLYKKKVNLTYKTVRGKAVYVDLDNAED